MTYEQAKEHKIKLEGVVNNYSKELQAFKSNDMGMTPDHTRNTSEWKKAKNNYDLSFKDLQTFNSWFIKTFKKQYLADRRNKRLK